MPKGEALLVPEAKGDVVAEAKGDVVFDGPDGPAANGDGDEVVFPSFGTPISNSLSDSFPYSL